MKPYTQKEIAEMQAMAHQTGYIVDLEQQISIHATALIEAERRGMMRAAQRVRSARATFAVREKGSIFDAVTTFRELAALIEADATELEKT